SGQAGHPRARRSHERARQRIRAPRAAGDRPGHSGRDVGGDRASTVHRAARGPDRRPERQADRGARPTRRAARAQRDLREALPAAVHRDGTRNTSIGDTMTEYLKGNYKLDAKVEEPAEASTDPTAEFEKKALSRLGGGACFLGKKRVPLNARAHP